MARTLIASPLLPKGSPPGAVWACRPGAVRAVWTSHLTAWAVAPAR